MPPVGDDGDAAALLQQFGATKQTASLSDKVADHVLLAEGSDRSWIARGVVQMFVAAILGVLTIYLVQGLTTQDWKSVALQATELVQSDVLPIVTLILGYYFGRFGRG